MGVVGYAERKTIKDALPPLGKLTMWLWAWGLMMLLTLFCRAVFGSLNSAVGWIPGVSGLVKQPIHKIEQKVSNYIGGAVSQIDTHIATSWHKLAAVVRDVPSQLVDQAGLIFGLAAALVVLPSMAVVRFLIHRSVGSVASVVHGHTKQIAHDHARTKALQKSVAQGVYPRLKVGEHERTHVLAPGVESARTAARTAEAEAIAVFKWVSAHRRGVAAGVFTAAVAWALARIGGGWIRCANWRKLGKRVCGMNNLLIDALLLDTLAIVGPISIVELAEGVLAVEDEILAAVKVGFRELKDIEV